MSFENEKDIIDDSQESIGDDSISWDNIIDTDQDGIVSIKNDSMPEISTEVFSNETVPLSIDSTDTNDAPLSESPSYETDEIDEEELRKILGADEGSDGIEYIDDAATYDQTELEGILNNDNTEDTEAPEIIGQDIEIPVDEDEILPRKEENKTQQSVSPVLVALIAALLVGAVVYFIFPFFMNNEDKDDLSQAVKMPSQNADIQNNDNMPPLNPNPQEVQNENIPVINEEEVSELKPEEKEGKKEIVAAVPTGRTDPFSPIQKFVYLPPPPKQTELVVKTLNNIDYDSIKIPMPPKQHGNLSEITTKLMTIMVSGIMYDTQKPSAIINYQNNDYFVQIGDKLDNFKVVDIGPNFVKIALGKNIYKAEVGENFKITEDFYGNIPYQGSSRQYYSSEDEYTNRVENAKKYTSDNDVRIYAK